ncbi:ribosome maturation factor RimM [Oceanibaculum indicum]|uniref:Ribosome maturation factor RimM n=1 Tax=Oceanibaculum indicum P24 TaxID=1207063 RepID=K2JNJ3_9PROT|nr:ribosome maturation factor RimM [Oceanibaculum indicum]EKE76853.1 16S rRNA processing protein RimM [Oceanibaculum indicum P24]
MASHPERQPAPAGAVDDGAAGHLVLLGVVVGAHGIRGQLRVRSFTGEPAAIFGYGTLTGKRRDSDAGRSLTLKPAGQPKGKVVLASMSGVADRNAAEALKGLRLYVSRDALPALEEDEFYHADLIGLGVDQVAGDRLGTVKAVHDFGAGDVLEVIREEGGSVFLPFTRAVVPVVDIAGGRLVADPPAELLESGSAGEEDAE